LETVADTCRRRGSVAHTAILDVRDTDAMESWIRAAGRLDLVVANAGIAAGLGDRAPERPDQARAIFATNLGGVLNTVLPALSVMADQPPGSDGVRGRIVSIASIAAFVAAPDTAAYCASKAAVDVWTVGNAHRAWQRGVLLTSVCPGFIRTAMTEGNRFHMPGLMDADRAARIILRGVAAGRVRVVFPWWLGLAARVAGLLPPRLMAAMAARQTGKARGPALTS
jgi:NAD(P)-dependent dehydrogenase (short-subunit alcohol dehydrogenase family)